MISDSASRTPLANLGTTNKLALEGPKAIESLLVTVLIVMKNSFLIMFQWFSYHTIIYVCNLNREGETNGVHYHFVNIDDMEKAVARGEFVEYAKVHTNMYGTSVEAVQKVRPRH